MLVARVQLVDRVIVDNLALHLEGLSLIVLLTIQQHISIPHAPGVQILLVPGEPEVLACPDSGNFFLHRDLDHRLDV